LFLGLCSSVDGEIVMRGFEESDVESLFMSENEILIIEQL
jgi:hypothetical protein